MDDLLVKCSSCNNKHFKSQRIHTEMDSYGMSGSACPLCNNLSFSLIEDNAETAYWRFDARVRGYAEWEGQPQSERDAFKAEYRELESRYECLINAEIIKKGDSNIREARLMRKIEKRDKRIAALEQELQQTQIALSRLASNRDNLSTDIENAMRNVLLNVRLFNMPPSLSNRTFVKVVTEHVDIRQERELKK